MDKLHKRRIRAAERTSEKNRNKFISEYVKSIHGDIYEEAQQLYETIKQKNPGRKDLTKTVEFMQEVVPNRTIPVYYYTRQKQQTGPRRNNTAGRTSSTTHMVLNIPLIEASEISTTVMATTTTGDLEMPASPPGQDQEDREMPASPPGHDQEDREMPSAPPGDDQEDSAPHLDIPDHMYEELLRELRQDPDLYQIFNNFNASDHDDTFIQESTENQHCDDMWDAFVPDEQTPLELQLSQLGY